MAVGIDSILCATDFSAFSGGTLGYGIQLARSFNARLHIFHAVHFATDGLYASDVLERGGKERRLAGQARRNIEESMAGVDVEWEAVVACGEPVEEIRGAALDRGVDMVVAASHGLSGFKRFILGTVVEKLARTLPLPLMTIRSPGPPKAGPHPYVKPIRRILAGCDAGPGGDPVLSTAIRYADRLEAAVHLLHAVEAPLDEDLVDPTGGPYEKVQNDLRERLRRRLENAVDPEAKARMDITAGVTAGLPGETLAAHAAAWESDLIIVGVRRRSALGKWFVGSTTESVLRHAPCPVLTIPHGT